HVLLVGAPHPDLVPRWLAEAERVAPGKPVRRAVMTHMDKEEWNAVRALGQARPGIEILVDHRAPGAFGPKAADADIERTLPGVKLVEIYVWNLPHGRQQIEGFRLGHAARPGDVAVYVQQGEVLFAGEACVHGPRADLAGSNTERWINDLKS